jgi:hypothetical protein
VCPVKAIYTEKDVPESQHAWIEVNRIRCRELPLLLLKQQPLPTAQPRRAELGF